MLTPVGQIQDNRSGNNDLAANQLSPAEPGWISINHQRTSIFGGLMMSIITEHMAREHKASTPVSTDSEAAVVHQQIASLAYDKAEARGFLPGYELHDWLEAEMEINGWRAQPEKH
jgi:Protein of unknown function (DUF2934)